MMEKNSGERIVIVRVVEGKQHRLLPPLWVWQTAAGAGLLISRRLIHRVKVFSVFFARTAVHLLPLLPNVSPTRFISTQVYWKITKNLSQTTTTTGMSEYRGCRSRMIFRRREHDALRSLMV